MLKSMIDELSLSVSVEIVRSECNKVDVLARVRKGKLVQSD